MRAPAITLAFFASLLVAHPSSMAEKSNGIAKSKKVVADEIASANASKKAVIVEFTADWCSPCKRFNRDVLGNQAVQRALTSVHFVKYDIDDKGPGAAAKKLYSVRGVPAILVLDSKGAVVRRAKGMRVEAFLDLIDHASLGVLEEGDIATELAASPDDPVLLMRAARWYRNNGDVTEAEAHYKRAFIADPTGKAKVGPRAAWESMMMRRHHDFRSRVARESLAFARQFQSEKLSGFELVVAGVSGNFKKETIESVADAIFEKTKDAELNATAYAFMAAGAVNAALDTARKQVELKPKDANAHDTLAEALYMHGDREDAIEASDMAVTMGQGSALASDFADNNARFRTAGVVVLESAVARRRDKALRKLAQPAGFDPVSQTLPKKPKKPAARRSALSSTQTDMERYYGEKRNAFESVATACRNKSNGLKEAFVRVKLAEKGGNPAKVWILEPDISRKLKRCLSKALKTTAFPKPLKIRGRVFRELINDSIRF